MGARELGREVLGIALMGVGLFLFLSLVSFDVSDLPERFAPAATQPSNWGGSAGAALAAWSMQWVGGLGTLGASLLLLAFGSSFLRRALNPERKAGEPVRRVVAGVILIVLLGGLEGVLAERGWGALARGLHPGGSWGIFLQVEFSRVLGSAGTPLALGALLALSLVLSTDRPLQDLLNSSATAAAAKARSGVESAEAALAEVAPPAPELAPEPAPALVVSAGVSRPALRDPLASPEAEAAAREMPSLELLTPAEPAPARPVEDPRGALIEETLREFKLSAKVVSFDRGPAVTLFAVELGRGIKVQRLAGLLDNLAISLRVSGIRLQAPIPGTRYVGLEVPNEEQDTVRFRELLEQPGWEQKDPALPVFLGKDSTGRPLIADLAKMPHLLIAGATGSGKSVCINSIIVSLLMTRAARDLRLILIDPKQVELAPFGKIPHLLHPVVTDMRQAGAVLEWAVQAMEERYTWLAAAGVRHIREYNALGKEELLERLGESEQALVRRRQPWHLPYVVLVVDELNDLMLVAQKQVETSITRLAQKSRAVGIHVVLATQRPSVDVVTGVIKSNLPARLAFRVSSKVDSRTILDAGGAEKLLGQGDMLFLPPGRGAPIRALGALVTDDEIRAVVRSLCKGSQPSFEDGLVAATEAASQGKGSGASKREAGGEDPIYAEAVRVVLASGKGSVSLIQRKLKVGYGRAARLLDLMSEQGLVGPARGSKAREVTTTIEAWEGQQEG